MRLTLFLLLLILPQAAHAKWHEASSEHFVIYADDSEKKLEEFATDLERYHAAMALVLNQDIPPPSPSNRVTIYAVGNDSKVRNLYGGDSRFVRGFYIPRAGKSLAIVPDIPTGWSSTQFDLTILLHEYAHHFLIGSLGAAMPRWVSEGAAEFYASAKFSGDKSVWVGRPAAHRANELANARQVPLQALFDDAQYDEWRGSAYDAYYGQSWLLFHYLSFNAERKGQLGRYLSLIRSGTESPKAAEQAFGSLETLEKDLGRYLKARRMSAYNIPVSLLPTRPVTVRELSEGEAAIMPVRIRSKVGVNAETAPEVAADAREIAARFPNDAAVLSILAEAEFDTDNYTAAVDAADRAIALNPSLPNPYLQKGYALFEMARDRDDVEAAYKEARQPFLDLNKLENDHPIPLIYFYRSYIQAGRVPTQNAFDALSHASALAPFDLGLRMNLAHACIQRGETELAHYYLMGIAHNPHSGGLVTTAKQMMLEIENGKMPTDGAIQTEAKNGEDSASG